MKDEVEGSRYENTKRKDVTGKAASLTLRTLLAESNHAQWISSGDGVCILFGVDRNGGDQCWEVPSLSHVGVWRECPTHWALQVPIPHPPRSWHLSLVSDLHRE